MPRFSLNLPLDLHRAAAEVAQQQGISLNQFILWSVAEKVGELRRSVDDPGFRRTTYRAGASRQPMPVLRGTGIRVQTIVLAAHHWRLSNDEIAEAYELTVRQVQECLAFYTAHRAELDAAIQAEEQMSMADA
jgi:uncharacterized protein (DUF433 family)